MKVFKFGGGILNSANAVKKIPAIIDMFPGEPLIIIVSAFGKTTNALEELIAAAYNNDEQTPLIFRKIMDFHEEISHELFPSPGHPVHAEMQTLWNELQALIHDVPAVSFSCFYDQVIGYGELLSSKMVSHALAIAGLDNSWADVRRILVTDSVFREATIDWEACQLNADLLIKPLMKTGDKKRPLIVTQGFIAADEKGRSTSLGREGSDYTASIFAGLLRAEEVIIWKDVPGILNADPKHFRQTVKLDQISYAEATELAYYGAKIIHPKTVKPLQNKGIPLQVRSFIHPEMPGTLVHAGVASESSIPNFIFKFDQVLMSVSTRDLSFIDEKVFTDVFALLTRYSIHMNIIQNSALTLSFCLDNHSHIKDLMAGLQENYAVKYNVGLELITIRHFDEKAAELVLQGKEVLLEQQNRAVVHYVVR